MSDWHGKPCYYCGEKISSIAANPELWGVSLCHEDDPGKIKGHHVGCVSKRLRERDKYHDALKEISELMKGANMTHYESANEALQDAIRIAQAAIAKR